jgi:hypothetical protein
MDRRCSASCARCSNATSRWWRPSPVRPSASAPRCCCTATWSTCPTKRAWPCPSWPGPGAGIRIQPGVPQLMGHAAAAEKLLLGDPFTGRAGGGLRHRQRGAAGRRGGEPRTPRGRALQRAAARRGAPKAKQLMRAPQRNCSSRPSPPKARCSPSACAAPRRWRPSRPSSRSASPTSASSEDPHRMSLTVKLALSPLLVAQALLTRRRMPRCPSPAASASGVAGAPAARRCDCWSRVTRRQPAWVCVTQREALAVLLADRLAQACGARVHWRLMARTGLTTAGTLHLLQREAATAGRRGRHRHRRQRRRGSGAFAPRHGRARGAGQLAAQHAERAARGLCAAAAHPPLSGPAAAACAGSPVPMRAATTVRWSAGPARGWMSPAWPWKCRSTPA